MKKIRCILLDSLMILTTIIMGICAFPIRLFFKDKALSYAKMWCSVMLFYYQKIGGKKIIIKGDAHLNLKKPAIIASQHQSGFDTLIWMLLLPKPCYVMKEELTHIPLLGPMLVLSGMMPIKRSSGVKALHSLLDGTKKAFSHGRQIIIFPQGTRTRPGQQIRLKSGIVAMADENKVPVYPVATNSGYFWNKDTLYPGQSVLRKGDVFVAIGSPLHAKEGQDLLKEIEKSWHHLEKTYPILGIGDISSQPLPKDG